MTILKPCPFCGSEDVVEEYSVVLEFYGRSHQDGYVECNGCGIGFTILEDFDPDIGNMTEELRRIWNTRVNPKDVK